MNAVISVAGVALVLAVLLVWAAACGVARLNGGKSTPEALRAGSATGAVSCALRSSISWCVASRCAVGLGCTTGATGECMAVLAAVGIGAACGTCGARGVANSMCRVVKVAVCNGASVPGANHAGLPASNHRCTASTAITNKAA